MNYLSNYYKNKAEQLQEQINFLENQLLYISEAQRQAIAPGKTADMEDAAAADAAFSMFRDAKEKVEDADTDDTMTRAKNLEARFSERLAQQGVADPAKIANPDRRYDDVEDVRARRVAEQGKAASSTAIKAVTNLGSQQPDTGFDFTKAGRGVADDPNSEYSKKQRSGGFDVSTAGNETAAAAKNLLDKMNAKAAQSSAPTGAGSTVSDAVNSVLTMGKGGSKPTGGTPSAPAAPSAPAQPSATAPAKPKAGEPPRVTATSNPKLSTFKPNLVTEPGAVAKGGPSSIQLQVPDSDFARRQLEQELGFETPKSALRPKTKEQDAFSGVVDTAVSAWNTVSDFAGNFFGKSAPKYNTTTTPMSKVPESQRGMSPEDAQRRVARWFMPKGWVEGESNSSNMARQVGRIMNQKIGFNPYQGMIGRD